MPRPDVGLMGAAEIGQRLRLSKQRTYVIIGRKGFPDPQAELAMGKVWLAEDVEAWIKENRPNLDDEETP
jgi:predicted DNA-binding transcriptional regulator AlpA